jgi:SAM-dependent methyltransferase
MWRTFVPSGVTTVVDVGCNVGEALALLGARGVPRLRGVDINPAAVAAARRNLAACADVVIAHASAERIPFEDGCADLVLCLETLEHVPAGIRPSAVAEMRRLLRPGGRLILTVPHRGSFAWLDPENIRFRFPRLYARASRLMGGAGKDAGYVGQSHGPVEHHHFTVGELESLLDGGFRVRARIGRGCLLSPLGSWLAWPFHRRGTQAHVAYRAISRMMQADYAVRYPLRLAYNLVLVADRTL